MNSGREPPVGFTELVLIRLFFLLIVFLPISAWLNFVMPYIPTLAADIEISGLKPGEKMVMKKQRIMAYAEDPADWIRIQADDKGVARFADVSFGHWDIVEGGTPELRSVRIWVPERKGEEIRGSVRVYVYRAIPRQKPPVSDPSRWHN